MTKVILDYADSHAHLRYYYVDDENVSAKNAKTKKQLTQTLQENIQALKNACAQENDNDESRVRSLYMIV